MPNRVRRITWVLVAAAITCQACYFAPGRKGPGRGTNVSSGWGREDDPVLPPPGTPTRTQSPP